MNNSPESITEYRLITLLDTVLKIFSKVLASRLTPYLPEMISDAQTSFVVGRNILDGVAIAYEVSKATY